MILELSDQDNVALEEISKILERHPDLKLIEMVVEPTLIFNHLIIDTGKRKVYYNQQEVLLTTKEYELLYRLALYEGRVLSYRQLYEAVWGEDPMGNEANAARQQHLLFRKNNIKQNLRIEGSLKHHFLFTETPILCLINQSKGSFT